MAPKYAQLPVFKYQTFDRDSLKFTDHPILPPPPPPQLSSPGVDADDKSKTNNFDDDTPNPTVAEPAAEKTEESADKPAEGK